MNNYHVPNCAYGNTFTPTGSTNPSNINDQQMFSLRANPTLSYNTNKDIIPGGVTFSFTPSWLPIGYSNRFPNQPTLINSMNQTFMNPSDNIVDRMDIQPNYAQPQKPYTFHHDRNTSTTDLYFPLYINEVTAINITNNKYITSSTGTCTCLDDENSRRQKFVCFGDSDSDDADSCKCKKNNQNPSANRPVK